MKKDGAKSQFKAKDIAFLKLEGKNRGIYCLQQIFVQPFISSKRKKSVIKSWSKWGEDAFVSSSHFLQL